MADRAILTETLCDVIWIGYRLKIRLMAIVTSGWSAGESSAVARRTDQRGMLTGQIKSGGGMIKGRGIPRCGRVAGGAVLIKLS